MFISKKLVFVELQKTGCTHIRRLLSEVLDGNLSDRKHDYPSSELFQQKPIFIGSIRNPWEWYISLWAYGCDQQGGFYERVTGTYRIPPSFIKKRPLASAVAYWKKIIKNPARWKDFYADVNDAARFRLWLQTVHNPAFRFDFGEGYGFSAIYPYAGVLTYRYLKLFCKNRTQLYSRNELSDFHSLKEFEKKNLYICHFIRNENLEKELVDTLSSCGITTSETQKKLIFEAEKTNISSRRYGCEYYYDNETLELVRNRERLIIEKFDYHAPHLNE